jgi:hypothetical protein
MAWDTDIGRKLQKGLDNQQKYSYIRRFKTIPVFRSVNHILPAGMLLCLLTLLIDVAHAQDWETKNNGFIARDLELTVNAGMTSYYGDLSIYDNSFTDKLAHESGFAFGIVGTKRLTPQIGISGQVIFGQLKGSNKNVSFESSILQYNLHVRLNLIRLFSNNHTSRFNWEALFGFGNFLFESTKTTQQEGDDLIEEHSSRVPELVFFGGTGISYRIDERIGIGMEISLHQFQNDKIDVTVKNNDFDYYTYLNVGITYYFRSFQKTAPRNKARIAHSHERLKPLDHDSK